MGEYREDTEFPDKSTTVSYSGEGGLHQLYLGAGFKIIKNLSVGANFSYLWGDITRTAAETFPSSSSVFPITIQSNVAVKSYKLDFGFLFMHARYASEHPAEKFEDCFKKPFHIAYGKGKKLAGELGEWLCFIIQDHQEPICIAQLIDGVKILPGKNYTAESLGAACNEKG